MMSKAFTIARRELLSVFSAPVAYVVWGLFALGAGLVFMLGFATERVATMRSVFDGVVWLLVFLVPAISMRSLSEELGRGTIEKLMSLPINEGAVVVGKWLGVWIFFLVMLLPLVAQALLLEWVGDPDWGPIVTGLMGLALVGGLYAAIGVMCSATTGNAVVAFVASVFIICIMTFGLYFLPESVWVGPRAATLMRAANVNTQFSDFARGLIDIRNFVYFASVTAGFLFIAIKLLESRRWR
jgi:ABC-2 type transport system permease protein